MIPGLMSKASETTVASTTTVTFKSDIVKVTGTTSIATITAPPRQGGFGTVVYVVPIDGTVATVTTGNIAKAVSMVQSQVCVFVFIKSTGLWYPGAIS